MAIKLVDIVAVMKSKWTYGDKFFGYTEEFNDNHNTQYPSILITPPTSVFPEVGVNNGWENYTFDIYFSDLYSRTQQANETIEQSWTNLQDLATEWLDMFLNHYQANAPIEAFLEDESVTIERSKQVANDQLLQLKMTFSWRVLSKCFRPVSAYPNQISDLVSWLRADSNTTFNISTQKVSAIGDGSVNTNGVSQLNSDNKPLRYNFDGASDKVRISFNGTSDYLASDNNCPITGNDFAIFYVGRVNALTVGTQIAVGYNDFLVSGVDRLNFGIESTGRLFLKAQDDAGVSSQLLGSVTDLGTQWHIGYASIKGTDFYLQYNNSAEVTINVPLYSNANGFNLTPFRVGDYWNGDIQEVIIYNRALSSHEVVKIQDYLNKKYRIY